MINDTNDLRFYGAGGMGVWFNSTSNGGIWNGYINTNVQGGDPGVLKVSANNYVMIYVGNLYSTGFSDEAIKEKSFIIYPNPSKSQINVKADAKLTGAIYTVYDNTGKSILTGRINAENTIIELDKLSGGVYLFSLGAQLKQTFKVIKE